MELTTTTMASPSSSTRSTRSFQEVVQPQEMRMESSSLDRVSGQMCSQCVSSMEPFMSQSQSTGPISGVHCHQLLMARTSSAMWTSPSLSTARHGSTRTVDSSTTRTQSSLTSIQGTDQPKVLESSTSTVPVSGLTSHWPSSAVRLATHMETLS